MKTSLGFVHCSSPRAIPMPNAWWTLKYLHFFYEVEQTKGIKVRENENIQCKLVWATKQRWWWRQGTKGEKPFTSNRRQTLKKFYCGKNITWVYPLTNKCTLLLTIDTMKRLVFEQLYLRGLQDTHRCLVANWI